MDTSRLEKTGECTWQVPQAGDMRVPAIIYADEALIADMDDKVLEQIVNVAGLRGIVGAAYAMPDAHWGYGFPIGGVAAFDPDEGGIICAGGVGFDVSCGVRLLLTDLTQGDIDRRKRRLADHLFERIPAGVGSKGDIELDEAGMDAMLRGGARWAVWQGYGSDQDLERIEENGCMAGALPECVSKDARRRQRMEMGTLGSGNHYCEVQVVQEIYDQRLAQAFGLRQGQVCISVHTGSRGLGHQIGTEYMREMVLEAPGFGIELKDRELACAPIKSDLGRRYIGAMRAAAN
ncbi:MAG: RtcB family protein, partial [Alphaproteobacteria bacterium]